MSSECSFSGVAMIDIDWTRERIKCWRQREEAGINRKKAHFMVFGVCVYFNLYAPSCLNYLSYGDGKDSS
ncbi:hypothetical protein V8B55DRAFT_1435751 [Mucor lusitanicus]